MAVEEPKFRLSLQEGAFEVREYPALIAADVTVGGNRNQAVNAGFRLLAGYIFGGNRRRQSIAMTAPVMQSPAPGEKIAMTAPVVQTEVSGAWLIRFIMPGGYSLSSLPTPDDPRVHLTALPPGRFAVVRFSGLAMNHDVELETAELMAFIRARRLRAVGPASLARYDPPWTPWFMRRNEIWVPISPTG